MLIKSILFSKDSIRINNSHICRSTISPISNGYDKNKLQFNEICHWSIITGYKVEYLDNVHDYLSMCRNVMATKISVSHRMMWKLGSKCLHDALSATVGDTRCPYFFIIPPRACKSHACGTRCGQFVTWSFFRMRRGVHEFYMKRPWRFAERERCVRFTKLQVATVNLHRPLLAVHLFRYFSKHLSQSLVNAWRVYLCILNFAVFDKLTIKVYKFNKKLQIYICFNNIIYLQIMLRHLILCCLFLS